MTPNRILSVRRCVAVTVLLLFLAEWGAAQKPQDAEPLSIATVTLPRPELRRQYYVRLEARGGLPPLDWELVRGELPPGIDLSTDGTLSGVPTKLGEYRFVVAVIDSAKPAHQRNQEFTLLVITPLLAEWTRIPEVTGQRIEGAIKVSNESDHDFDLTMIAVAVNDIGRATALGYQHFTLRSNTAGQEISFGENLPPGTYQVHVDVVAEVKQTNAIYRVHLDRPPLQILQGP